MVSTRILRCVTLCLHFSVYHVISLYIVDPNVDLISPIVMHITIGLFLFVTGMLL